ncbi:ADP-ribosylglycohydrolase family protein [Phytoactinopolyspora limicola]|uniref:ADP-ribosylglycohydrolase family protein n=1 Tax=Phytoactinopolyspora limicola TaxID=2715536 RepID=UPI001A9C43A3|nr:ADP-ribosylglycohydrolase family protein [Phytoactinopolyspora limicola]
MTDPSPNVLPPEASSARAAGRDVRHGALIGLAIGDAAGWPARQHRSRLLPPWTRRLRRELDTFAETQDVTSLPVPFALNQDPTPLRLGPSDDAEWAAWTLTWLSTMGDVTREAVHEVWRVAATSGTVPRGRISVATAVDGLQGGVEPPHTGRHNPHHFDDAAAVRAVAVGAAVGDPDRAAEVAGWDAEVTNAGDGVDAARFVARFVAAAVAGGTSWHQMTDGGLDRLGSAMSGQEDADSAVPEGTLLGRTVRRAVEATAEAASPAEAIPLLDEVVDRVYSYGTAAAQTAAIAVALTDITLRHGTPPIDAITAAACLPSLADSAPALTGALVGAARGAGEFPVSWVGRCRVLAGCCAPDLAGVDIMDLLDRATGPVVKEGKHL